MVKKLYKHELNAYWRIALPMWGILLAVSLLGRVVQFFEFDHFVYDIVNTSSIVFYVIAVTVALVFPVVFAIIRFYKNLFTGEGYLSFTLPVTVSQHITVKVLGAVTVAALSFLVALTSLCVITAGDVLVELWKAGVYILNYLNDEIGAHLWWLMAEAVVLLLVLLVSQTLYYDTCISLGQLFRKNRVLAAVGVYFGFYIIAQVLSTIMVIIAMFMDWEGVTRWIVKHPFTTLHGGMCGLIVFGIAACVVEYLVTYLVIRRRLNLE